MKRYKISFKSILKFVVYYFGEKLGLSENAYVRYILYLHIWGTLNVFQQQMLLKKLFYNIRLKRYNRLVQKSYCNLSWLL